MQEQHPLHPEHPAILGHQFEDIEQQNESYIVGMWAFLVTEVLFFGALFAAYIVYRAMYPQVWLLASHQLNYVLGGVNTLVLLFSSFMAALAVRAAMLNAKRAQILFLTITILCAATFLVVKYFEYSEKIHHHLVPGPSFEWPPHVEGGSHAIDPTAVAADKAQIFFSLYFIMTGLHGLHVLIGIFVFLGIIAYVKRDKRPKQDYIPTEMAALYWHFVDIVWIFLYPLFYLIDLSHLR